MSRGYVPDRGEVVWVDFNPQSGHEQAGHRPAVVISNATFNRSGLFAVMPVTNTVRGNPFEVPVPPESGATGVVLANQLKTLDWRSRKAVRKGRVPPDVVTACVGLHLAVVDPDGEFTAAEDE
jgi:mRNA interferase MazF